MLATMIQISVTRSAKKSANGMNSSTPRAIATQPIQRGKAEVKTVAPAPSIMTPNALFHAIQLSPSSMLSACAASPVTPLINSIREREVNQRGREQHRRLDHGARDQQTAPENRLSGIVSAPTEGREIDPEQHQKRH